MVPHAEICIGLYRATRSERRFPQSGPRRQALRKTCRDLSCILGGQRLERAGRFFDVGLEGLVDWKMGHAAMLPTPRSSGRMPREVEAVLTP